MTLKLLVYLAFINVPVLVRHTGRHYWALAELRLSKHEKAGSQGNEPKQTPTRPKGFLGWITNLDCIADKKLFFSKPLYIYQGKCFLMFGFIELTSRVSDRRFKQSLILTYGYHINSSLLSPYDKRILFLFFLHLGKKCANFLLPDSRANTVKFQFQIFEFSSKFCLKFTSINYYCLLTRKN